MTNPSEPMKGCNVYRVSGQEIAAESLDEARELAKASEPLYAVYCDGPDEIHAAPSRHEAAERAKMLNELAEEHYARNPSPNWPCFHASVIQYPGTPEQHAEAVKMWEKAT